MKISAQEQRKSTSLLWCEEEKKKLASRSIIAGNELPHDYSSLNKMWNTPGGLMEVRRISSSMSVRGCGNQRQSSISPLSDGLMKCLLLSVGEVRLGSVSPVVWSQRCDGVVSVSPREQSYHSFPPSPKVVLNSLGSRML